MIVEPKQIHSRSPLRRLLRGVGFVAPPALLVLALAAGLLGPRPAPAPDALADASASPVAVAPAEESPTSSPVDAATGAPVSPRPPALDLAVFPTTYRSIRVDTPSSAMARRMSPGGLPDLAVVAGYLAMIDAPMRCVGRVPLDAWCDRTGILFEVPGPGGIDTSAFRPAHLHVAVPAGVVLPSAVVSPSGSTGAGYAAVMLAGRFAPATCTGGASACDLGFKVDRLVWAAGADEPLQPLVELGQGRASDAVAPEPEDGERLPLVAVLATPIVVAGLDPVAGAAAKRIPGPVRAVWYVRDVVLARDGALLTRWVLLDPTTGNLLATGPSDVRTPSGSPGTPGAPAG